MEKTALVTGGSSGIGFQICRLLAKDGYSIVLVARNKKELDAAAGKLKAEWGAKTYVIPLDLSKTDSPSELFSKTQKMGLQIQVLVNNAGFGLFGEFKQTDLETELAMLQVNIVALTALTKLYCRPMVQRGDGMILNLASTAAFQPGPLMAVYYASKAYVLSFSEALSNELGGTGVTVTALCPGPTDTRFKKRAGLHDSKLFATLSMMNPEYVAKEGYRGMLEGKAVVIPGFRNRALNFLQRFAPRSAVVAYVRRMQEARQDR